MGWSGVVALVATVPPAVWVAAMVGNVALTAAPWSVARRRIRRAGQRIGDPDPFSQARARDTALTLASLVPVGLFWMMVLGGRLHGLVAFGRTTLGWRCGWEYLVPGTVDGVSVTFAMLALRAVKRGKTPDRCYGVVWGTATASATINFAHEYGMTIQSANRVGVRILASSDTRTQVEDRVTDVPTPHRVALTVALFQVARPHDGPTRVAVEIRRQASTWSSRSTRPVSFASRATNTMALTFHGYTSWPSRVMRHPHDEARAATAVPARLMTEN